MVLVVANSCTRCLTHCHSLTVTRLLSLTRDRLLTISIAGLHRQRLLEWRTGHSPGGLNTPTSTPEAIHTPSKGILSPEQTASLETTATAAYEKQRLKHDRKQRLREWRSPLSDARAKCMVSSGGDAHESIVAHPDFDSTVKQLLSSLSPPEGSTTARSDNDHESDHQQIENREQQGHESLEQSPLEPRRNDFAAEASGVSVERCQSGYRQAAAGEPSSASSSLTHCLYASLTASACHCL